MANDVGYFIILLTDATAKANAEIRVLCYHKSDDADRITTKHFHQADRFATFDKAVQAVRRLWHSEIATQDDGFQYRRARLLPTWHPTIVRVVPMPDGRPDRLDFACTDAATATTAPVDGSATQEEGS